MSNPWSPEHPDRVMLLGVAENVLTWDFFQQNVHRFYSIHDQDNRFVVFIVHSIHSCSSVPEWASGRPYLKQALAKFISNRVFCSPVKPEELVVVSGSGTVMDMISYSFLDPGDGFIGMCLFLLLMRLCFRSLNVFL